MMWCIRVERHYCLFVGERYYCLFVGDSGFFHFRYLLPDWCLLLTWLWGTSCNMPVTDCCSEHNMQFVASWRDRVTFLWNEIASQCFINLTSVYIRNWRLSYWGKDLLRLRDDEQQDNMIAIANKLILESAIKDWSQFLFGSWRNNLN
jgi:hypothetical protein